MYTLKYDSISKPRSEFGYSIAGVWSVGRSNQDPSDSCYEHQRYRCHLYQRAGRGLFSSAV